MGIGDPILVVHEHKYNITFCSRVEEGVLTMLSKEVGLSSLSAPKAPPFYSSSYARAYASWCVYYSEDTNQVVEYCKGFYVYSI